jgi:hypothetical protein
VSEPERLSGELDELLEAERDIEAPTPEKRERLLVRLGPLVIPGALGAGVGAAAAGASSGAETAATGKAAGAVGAGLKAKLVIAAIAGAVGAMGGAATHAALTAPAKTPVPAPSASARAIPPLPVTLPSAPAPEPLPSPEIALPPTPSAGAPTRSSGTGAAGAATLRAERLLLERATTALARGDSASALTALREHARRFPRGELAEEREVLLVRALRAAGQSDAADQRAKDFKRQFPSSLQKGTIDATPSSR